MGQGMGQEVPHPRADAGSTHRYQTPQIEAVLTPEDLEREVKYAGEPSPIR